MKQYTQVWYSDYELILRFEVLESQLRAWRNFGYLKMVSTATGYSCHRDRLREFESQYGYLIERARSRARQARTNATLRQLLLELDLIS